MSEHPKRDNITSDYLSDLHAMLTVMTMTDRGAPAFDADERTVLEGWLDFYRTTLRLKCEGLTEAQLRAASAPPSPLTLFGLVQHMAEVERNWFRRVLTGEDIPAIYDPHADTDKPDGGFELSDDITFSAAITTWETEIAMGRTNCSERSLDQVSPFLEKEVNLRWIYTHVIAEYARHCGHADLIRERIDGATGV